MATLSKFNTFVQDLAHGAHNLATNSLVVALTNTAPTAGNSVLADITQISYTNLSARALTTASSSQTGGIYKLFLNDLVLNATGSVATFRYVVVYNDSSTGDRLIGYADYGQSITMQNGESLTIAFDQVDGAIEII
jgi:hypothetical protein